MDDTHTDDERLNDQVDEFEGNTPDAMHWMDFFVAALYSMKTIFRVVSKSMEAMRLVTVHSCLVVQQYPSYDSDATDGKVIDAMAIKAIVGLG